MGSGRDWLGRYTAAPEMVDRSIFAMNVKSCLKVKCKYLDLFHGDYTNLVFDESIYCVSKIRKRCPKCCFLCDELLKHYCVTSHLEEDLSLLMRMTIMRKEIKLDI